MRIRPMAIGAILLSLPFSAFANAGLEPFSMMLFGACTGAVLFAIGGKKL